jgi:hypothetical protein
MSASEDPAPVGNRLLAASPGEVHERLRTDLEAVSLKPRDVVYEPHGPIAHVSFPTNCIVSLVAIMRDDAMYELATVGLEGMVGLPVFLETETAP